MKPHILNQSIEDHRAISRTSLGSTPAEQREAARLRGAIGRRVQLAEQYRRWGKADQAAQFTREANRLRAMHAAMVAAREKGVTASETQGEVAAVSMDSDTLRRFMSRLVITDSCWEWTGYIQPNGYGLFSIGAKKAYAHRVAHEWWNGPIPDGFEIDHLCRNRKCVRPEHLEAVTRRVNWERGISPVGRHRTECPNGHPFTSEDSLIVWRGIRRCRICRTAQERARDRKGERLARASRRRASQSEPESNQHIVDGARGTRTQLRSMAASLPPADWTPGTTLAARLQ